MQRYQYIFDEATQQVARQPLESYPDEGLLARMQARGTGGETFVKALKRQAKGRAQKHFINIEEKWFEIQEAYQGLTIVLEEPPLAADGTARALYAWEQSKEDFEAQATSAINAADFSEEKDYALACEAAVANAYAVLASQKETLLNARNKLESGSYWEDATRLENGKEIIERVSRQLTAGFYPWLKAYRGVELADDETPRPEPDGKVSDNDLKEAIRNERNNTVRGLEDTVADQAKMLSILTTVASRLYAVVPANQKAKLDEDDRKTIEYFFEKFSGVNTRADRQFENEGTALIDKLLDREAKVADLIDELKNKVSA